MPAGASTVVWFTTSRSGRSSPTTVVRASRRSSDPTDPVRNTFPEVRRDVHVQLAETRVRGQRVLDVLGLIRLGDGIG
jgi:hypothetical protein